MVGRAPEAVSDFRRSNGPAVDNRVDAVDETP
jgi:hypothetical protein